MTTATQEQRMTKRVSAIDVFRERCEARALLFAVGEIDLHAAVDQLQADAMFSGLVSEIGQDAVQRIMSDAFAAVRRKEIEK